MAGMAFDASSNQYKGTSFSNSSNVDINTDTDQSSEQDANSSTKFGNVENVGNNNQVSDFGNIFINNQQYGGNNKSVNISYQGDGTTQFKHTPIRDLTMSGWFDVEDSPADTAKFVNKYSDLNTTNQQAYKSGALTSVAKYMALGRDNKAVDTAELDKRIQAQPQYHHDMSIVEGAHTFGDQYGATPAEWSAVKPEDEDIKVDEDLKNEIMG